MATSSRTKPIQTLHTKLPFPYQNRIQKFRSLIYRCTTEADFRELWQVVIDGAKAGDKFFVKEFFDRLIGKPSQHIEVAQVDALFSSDSQRQIILEVLGLNPDPLCPAGEQQCLPDPAAHLVPREFVPSDVAQPAPAEDVGGAAGPARQE